ncbi:MAG: hypothetical protein QOF45_576 [Gaiellaceae bacterium]|jgi:hypothetical protein|nr:hypothetical protein [Gaiellaceae bacterium]
MYEISIRSWSAVVAVTAVVLVGASLAEASTFEKPVPGGSHGKAPPARGPGNAGAGKGIVQSVSATAIVLRELDGSTVRIPVAANTHVFVNGLRASLRDVRAGFVASAVWKAGKPARVLQAFNLSGPKAVSVGVVDSVSTGAVVVTGTGGSTVSIRVDAKTRVLVDGKPSTLAAVRAGYTVVRTAKDAKGGRPARELRFLRPG